MEIEVQGMAPEQLPKSTIRHLVQHQIEVGVPLHAPWYRSRMTETELRRVNNPFADQDGAAGGRLSSRANEWERGLEGRGTGVFLPETITLQDTECNSTRALPSDS